MNAMPPARACILQALGDRMCCVALLAASFTGYALYFWLASAALGH